MARKNSRDLESTPGPAPDAAGNPFADAEPIKGLEHLGRAIADKQGAISGSPANYEETRGAWHPLGNTAGAQMIARMKAELAGTADHEQAVAAVRDAFGDVGTKAATGEAISEADVEAVRQALRGPDPLTEFGAND